VPTLKGLQKQSFFISSPPRHLTKIYMCVTID
jgi:hypothetical protein